MINTNMRLYDYFLLNGLDLYGQQKLPKITDTPKGTILISICISSLANQDNIKYKNCSYIGLTKENITDKYLINYNNQLLKVLYINPIGRYNQVFLGEI